jgi:hypothetical protein
LSVFLFDDLGRRAGRGLFIHDASLAQAGYRLMPKTIHGMVVHHARRLHVCVRNRRADESEAALEQVLADRVG